MAYTSMSYFGPGSTSPTVRNLIIFTCIISILSAATQTIFDQFGLSPGPEDVLALSWHGISKGFIWQIATYFFIQESMPYGITFFYLITLAFNMYLLWVFGSPLVEMVGKKSFLSFYFVTGILAGTVALLIMPLSGDYTRVVGLAPLLLAMLTAWCMAFSDAELLLFFLIPIKAKWLIGGIIAAVLLVSLSHADFNSLGLYLSAIFFGYAYAVIAWGWNSPFEQTKPLDRWLASVGLRLRRYLPYWKSTKKQSDDKIVNIQTGRPPSNDDEFIDAMLAKISKHGESSLTWTERRRMQQISERKMNKR